MRAVVQRVTRAAVHVDGRLTGEIGSSSNPISGMTIATPTWRCVMIRFAR
jgi:D-Tyr-tRNAtyr deacylase